MQPLRPETNEFVPEAALPLREANAQGLMLKEGA